MNDEFEKLTDDERKQFNSLARQHNFPSTLEDNVVEALKKENLIHSPKPKKHWFFPKLNPVFASLLGAFLIAFALSATWYFGVFSSGEKSPQFILLLRESPGHSKKTELSAEQLNQLSEDYAKWVRTNQEKGILKEGDNLENEVRILDTVDGYEVVSDKKSDDEEDLIIGWFIIRAKNFDEAVKIARTCPHYDFGRIEVRKIENPKLN